jgi:hypothetical protein
MKTKLWMLYVAWHFVAFAVSDVSDALLGVAYAIGVVILMAAVHGALKTWLIYAAAQCVGWVAVMLFGDSEGLADGWIGFPAMVVSWPVGVLVRCSNDFAIAGKRINEILPPYDWLTSATEGLIAVLLQGAFVFGTLRLWSILRRELNRSSSSDAEPRTV